MSVLKSNTVSSKKTNSASCIRCLTLFNLFMLLCAGCQTYEQQSRPIREKWQQGNVLETVEDLNSMAEKNNENGDAVIWQLEQGAALRASGQFMESNAAFEAAEAKINEFDQEAKVKIMREAGGMFSNQAQLPYEGRIYDKILLNTYKALNYLELGEPDNARVEFVRAQQRQYEAVEINKARIDKAEAELAKAKEKQDFNSDKVKDDQTFKTQFDNSYAFLDQYKAESNYKNPAAVYLYGLFFMSASTGEADYELAKHSFDEVSGMLGDSKLIQKDQELLEKIRSGQDVPSTTYVVFETGCAPIREQIRIDLPIIVAGAVVGAYQVPYIGAAFPTVKPQDGTVPYLSVSTGETTESTVLLANMDVIVGQEFKNELPIIITKTMASTLAKAAVAYVVIETARQQGMLFYIIASLGSAGWQASVNISDTRTWTTLPKEFQACRINTPTDRKIQIASPDGLLNSDVTVEEGSINLIYVKAINTTSPLIISQVKLK